MTDAIAFLRSFITQKQHHVFRRDFEADLATAYSSRGMTPAERMAERLEAVLATEQPVILPGERILFTRTIKALPDIFTAEEWLQIKSKYYLHEKGFVCNICADYAKTIFCGLEKRRSEILSQMPASQGGERAFLLGLLRAVGAVEALAGRYRDLALRLGNAEAAEILSRVPMQGARTFHEALQFFRILHFTLWAEGEYHNTVGRFDQYMYPYLSADLDAGRITLDQAFELLEEFFLSFNKDSDLYPGVQQGDNGQSMVLGGVKADGSDGFNLLSEMCLEASRELKLIDPKINLRTNKATPLETYEKGTRLTREGLGFPQYSNDDVVIPGLVGLGYRPEDAANYVVAACWEFIVPGSGMDIPNIGALSFPAVVNEAMEDQLCSAGDFEGFLSAVLSGIGERCKAILAGVSRLWTVPAPFLSLLMDGCVERMRDISQGSRYNNYGIHGTGLSTAVDSLTAIRALVFDEKSVSVGKLVAAVRADFEGYDGLLHRVRYELPKLGDGSEGPAALAARLLDAFSVGVCDLRNERGGCVRAGTGSAMYYLWHAAETGASADGRRAGEPFAANYSPSLYARIPGPVSVIRDFTVPDLKKVINGGPLTLEFHSSMFRTDESVRKVASLIKWFIECGGHQLQLNAVSREQLLDAQAHPEQHAQLIVRVWGWSAYFIELDRGYQDHVLSRQEYGA